MKRSDSVPSRRRYMAAMVLGTALSALGPAAADGPATPNAGAQAVNDLSRYCTACWRNARLHPDSWTDCTQEVFTRLMERVDPDSWQLALGSEGIERREFLRAIDTVKKRSQRSRKWSSVGVDLADPNSLHERRLRDDRQAVQEASTLLLSSRQRAILRLMFEGWSVRDIAGKLDLPPERISDEKYKAVAKLRDHFNGPATGSGERDDC